MQIGLRLLIQLCLFNRNADFIHEFGRHQNANPEFNKNVYDGEIEQKNKTEKNQNGMN